MKEKYYDYAFYYICRAKCPVGKGCDNRKNGNYNWEELKEVCPKMIQKGERK